LLSPIGPLLRTKRPRRRHGGDGFAHRVSFVEGSLGPSPGRRGRRVPTWGDGRPPGVRGRSLCPGLPRRTAPFVTAGPAAARQPPGVPPRAAWGKNRFFCCGPGGEKNWGGVGRRPRAE